jgi:hypothetical protein
VSENQYLRPAEIAATMAMPRSTVYGLIGSGAFGAEVLNVGTQERPRYRVPAAAFDAWRESRKVRALSDPMPVARSRPRGSVRREVIPLSSRTKVT